MKQTLTTLTLITLLTILSCKKDSDISQGTLFSATPVQSISQHIMAGHTNGRYSGSGYSQPIPVDTANKMVLSYLQGVGYPSVDTATRSMVFDADTLRAYLQNPNIATMKFMFAHKQSYMNSGNTGIGSGMNPEALTMVVVGLDENDQYILNPRGQVYDHLANCPIQCPGSSDAIIQ